MKKIDLDDDFIREINNEINNKNIFLYINDFDQSKNSKSKKISIFFNNTITGLMSRVINHAGITRTEKIKEATIIYGKQLDDKDASSLHFPQKFSHFFHAWMIGRKNELHMRIKELSDKCGEVDFYPKTYWLPDDIEELEKHYDESEYYIYKPAAASRGKNLNIFSSSKKLKYTRGIIQTYIYKPFLINKKKFDIRLYYCIASLEPLVIFRHKGGFARFASYEYSDDITNICSHITNTFINKEHGIFYMTPGGKDDIRNSKWSYEFLLKYLEGYTDTKELENRIDTSVLKLLIYSQSKIREDHKELIGYYNSSFELYGVDIILDADLNPYILEVNLSPSMEGGESKLDTSIKMEVLKDTLNVACIQYNYTVHDVYRNMKLHHMSRSNEMDEEIASFISNHFLVQYSRRRNYKLLYPSMESNLYGAYFYKHSVFDEYLSNFISNIFNIEVSLSDIVGTFSQFEQEHEQQD